MARKKVALGRGLDSLLPSDDPLDVQAGLRQVAGGIFEVRIDRITPNPYQPRQTFDDDALNGLAQSIEELGIIQPITVRAVGNDRFEVIAGERRLRAARRVGLRTVPAFVRVTSAEEMLEMALVENVQREQLNPIELALGYQRLIEECGLQQAQVARRVGKTRSTVTNFLRLLRLPPRIQIALRERTLSVGHARALLGLSDAESQLRLFENILRKNLSVRQVESHVQQLTQRIRKPREPVLPTRQSLQVQEFEKSLRSRYGTKVKLTCDASGKGKVELHYYSTDDLARMLDLLMGTRG